MLYSLNISPNRHCPSPVKENRYNPMRVSHHIIIHSLKTEYEYVSKETVQNIVSEIVKAFSNSVLDKRATAIIGRDGYSTICQLYGDGV